MIFYSITFIQSVSDFILAVLVSTILFPMFCFHWLLVYTDKFLDTSIAEFMIYEQFLKMFFSWNNRNSKH